MANEQSRIDVHGVVIDSPRWMVLVEGVPIALTKYEFLLLRLLASRPGVAHTRQQIIDATSGPEYPSTPRSVDVQIVGLRKKLGGAGRLIETVRRVGYRFKAEPTRGQLANS